jgi:hypothetical protein
MLSFSASILKNNLELTHILKRLLLIVLILDGNALVNSAESLERKQAGVLDELVVKRGQEEIIGQNLIAFSQLDLSTVEIEIHIQTFD